MRKVKSMYVVGGSEFVMFSVPRNETKQSNIEQGCTACIYAYLRPNNKISIFRVTGLKILGRVGKHMLFFWYFFSQKNTLLCILKGNLPFKMHKIILF